MKPAAAYARATTLVQQAIAEIQENDPDAAAYLVARAALVGVRSRSGSERASALGYKLADELATESIP